MSSVSYEAARALRVVQLLRENLAEVLTALIAAGERDLAGQVASRMGTTEYRELGDRATIDGIRAAGICAGFARTAVELRTRIRAELVRRGIRADTPEAFAKAVARMARESGP